MKLLLKLLVFCLISSQFISCEKSEGEPELPKEVTRIVGVQYYINDVLDREVTYDYDQNNGNLLGMMEKNINGTITGNYSISKDEQGYTSRLGRKVWIMGSSIQLFFCVYSNFILYSPSVIEMFIKNPTFYKEEIVWDLERITSKKLYKYNGANTADSLFYCVYKHDNQGNVYESEVYTNPAKDTVILTEYEYDDVDNPCKYYSIEENASLELRKKDMFWTTNNIIKEKKYKIIKEGNKKIDLGTTIHPEVKYTFEKSNDNIEIPNSQKGKVLKEEFTLNGNKYRNEYTYWTYPRE